MSAPARAPDPGLVDTQIAGRVGAYLQALWSRRSYAWYVAASTLRQRQITTVFGTFWYLLNPALSIAVYFLIFGVVLKTDRGVERYLLFLTIGMFVFQFTQRAVLQGASSIVSNKGMVQAIRFPRALLPLSATLTEALSAIPTLVVIYIVALVMGQPLAWTWILLPVIAVWQTVFNLGAAMIAARFTTHFRDMQQLLPFIFRLLMYWSGVIFSVERYVSGRALELTFVLNPLYGFISMARWAVMGMDVSAETVLAVIVWTVTVVVGGFFWFKAGEHSYDRI